MQDLDDTPWASPEIRSNYELALGKFLLMYNQIDYLLLKILKMSLKKIKREDLEKNFCEKDFSFRVDMLDLLKTTTEGSNLSKLPTNKLKQLSRDRALLAHSHMDQNPFDGSYSLIWRGKDKGRHFSSEKINKMTYAAHVLWSSLRDIEALYIFEEAS